MEPQERALASPQASAEADVTQSDLQTSTHQQGAPSHSLTSLDQRQTRLESDGLDLQQPSLFARQPVFQDSSLSPALPLFPENSGVGHNFTEYSLFQQSDHEFAPLRAFPDISMASGRFHFPSRDVSTQSSECCSLSQHPLAQATLLSEEGVSSSCSLSQHSLSPGDSSKVKDTAQTSLALPTDRKKDAETLTDPGESADETFFLSKDVPAQHLLDLLQKDFGMPSSSSSAFSSASETSRKTTEEAKSSRVCKPGIEQSMERREGPTGEVSLPHKQMQPSDRDVQTQALPPEVCNITTGRRSTSPDDRSEVLHRELLSEVSKNTQQRNPTPAGPSLTPYPTERREEKPSTTRTSALWTGPFSAGVERGLREPDLWSSGNQTGIDGSYLGFLPQSQSTPGVLKAPPKSSMRVKLGQLSDIESSKESTHQSSIGALSQADAANQCQEETSSAKVQSLPSLNFMEKVDAWRANQSSGKTSLFDSLALQGFSGVSPKKKAYDAVSDSLNRILSQQARSLQQPAALSAANPNVTQNSSTAPSASSSSKRGEAVGSAPSDIDNTGSTVRPSASPYGRSQSHSSVNTVMSVHKDQQTEANAEKESSQLQEVTQPGVVAQPSPFMSLGHFSDVSLDRDSTLSSSRDSNNYEIKLGTSIGASSVVSLEVDNYAPYWTSKMSTPPPQPRPREFSIEERIPLYLRNLGIDQSPSTILTPFAPQGPIREPEFSPTDLCTVKGSTGTPTKSAQPSEGGSPQKEEFSRCSVLSVDSNMSVPFSMDSLGPPVSLPERPRRASPLSNTEALQSERSLTSFEPVNPHPSALQIPLRDDSLSSSQSTIHSPLHTSKSVELNAEDSFVSSNALFEIRKLISQAEDVVSAGSSSASAAAPRLLSDNDIFLSLRNKSTKLQDSLFSSSSAVGDPSTGTSLLWTRSSSDSMLTSDKVRESSIGQERTASSGQPSFPTNQAPATSPHRRPGDKIVSRDAGLSFIPSQSSRRAEPEGCSAAPPDNAAPPQPAVVKPSQQLPSTPAEEEAQTAPQSPGQSSSSTPIPEDQGAMSDGSSESSLAIRVAKLLQNESPSTMVSSTTSTTDQEESKAREWIKLKISGQECEPLELDKEDRRRVEEIKRELLLKNPIKSPRSTDTESSATSSIRAPTGQHPSLQTETVTSTDDANKQPSQQSLRRDLSDPDTQLHPPPASNLEAQVREIAAREGVTLPRSNSLALKSITIATRRRSTSPSPSTSPAPPLSSTPEMLQLHELSTEAAKQSHAHVHVEEEDEAMTNQNRISQSSPGLLKRQDTVGGQLDEAAPSLQVLDTQKMDAKDSQQVFSREGDLPIHDSSVPEALPPFEPAARTGHVTRVLLTLSPKGPDYSSATSVLPAYTDAVTAPPHKEFLPLRLSPSAVSSPDEGVGLSSPPEWSDSREAVRQRGPDRADASALFRPAVHQRKMTAASASAQSSKPLQEMVAGPRPSTNQTPAVPVLLPYKPRGSEELFYVPQTKADLSSTDHSDTTMESTHTGSDDAVPPHFSSDVLGHKDPGLDRGVTTRHSEGIYSKRLKTATFRMREPEHRGVSKSADAAAQTSRIQTPKPSSHISVAFTRVPLSAHQEPSRRDQGTSPVQFLSPGHPETITETLVVDTDFGLRHRGFVPQTVSERDQERMNSDPAQPSSALDQLWQKFCDRWSLEESRSTSDREASLLERLERLSRLIHSTRKTETSGGRHHPGGKEGGRREDAMRKERWRDVKPLIPHQAWTQRIQAAESSPADEDQHDSITSSISHDSTLSPTLRPADRDESDSGSMSTVDTARLIRAFGAHRVRHLKTSSGLSKLYSAINRQRDGREQRREQPHILTPSETTGSDESTVDADSVSWSSASTLQSHHGPSKALTAKRGVKLVNKGIQAGDLELVSNATRRHTRDVGTTFPSPAESRTSRRISSSSSSLERGRGGKSSLRQRRVKKSPSKTFPQGVSWFISAEELRSEARKENQPEEEEEEEGLRPSTAWFEPLSRTKPWREPLRQRQVHEDREERQRFILQDDPDPSAKTTSSGPARVSLQEALQRHRPDFISQSTQRVQRLALQAEERRLQADFIREREDLFSRPGGAGRLPRPAGTALLRRAVPRKEMIQRSKQIYENLPEVQRRREEERRKAEYRSYRLNAQLYNKKITSRVLGRRAAWP